MRIRNIGPGVVLAMGLGILGVAAGALEARLLGRAWLEGLVLAIIFGLVVRWWWTPGTKWTLGIHFCAKPLLEVAIVLLGASVDGMALWKNGPFLLPCIGLIVVMALALGIAASKLCGLSPKLGLLVACGNAICGNSAIAAVAPLIDADEEQISTAVAFTALGSIAVVVFLPLLIPVLGLDARGFGTLAGLSVYAVPQVLAATAGASVAATQMGTLVKLARVLMLGPVALGISLWNSHSSGDRGAAKKVAFLEMVPPFIIGFAVLAALRTFGFVPPWGIVWGREVAGFLTIAAMAALGLSSDPRAALRAGKSVLGAAALSLFALVTTAWLFVHLFAL